MKNRKNKMRQEMMNAGPSARAPRRTNALQLPSLNIRNTQHYRARTTVIRNHLAAMIEKVNEKHSEDKSSGDFQSLGSTGASYSAVM